MAFVLKRSVTRFPLTLRLVASSSRSLASGQLVVANRCTHNARLALNARLTIEQMPPSRAFSSADESHNNNKSQAKGSEASRATLKTLEKDVRQLKQRVDKYLGTFAKEADELRSRITSIIKRQSPSGASAMGEMITEHVRHGAEPEPESGQPGEGREILIEDVHDYASLGNVYKVAFDFPGHKSSDLRVFLSGNKVAIRSLKDREPNDAPGADANHIEGDERELVAHAIPNSVTQSQTQEEELPAEAILTEVRALFDERNAFLIVEVGLPAGINADEIKAAADAHAKQLKKEKKRRDKEAKAKAKENLVNKETTVKMDQGNDEKVKRDDRDGD